MDYFSFGETATQASRLAFGCGSILGFHDRGTSLRALHAAREHGVTLFDLARSYGYGQAESLFGQFARGRRSDLLVVSKFGTVPDTSIRANAIRILRGGVGGLRHLTGGAIDRAAVADPFSEHWSPASLRTTLYRSLRELQTDYIDLYLLHSPPEQITLRMDLFATLDHLQEQGVIRGYGLSTSAREGTRALALARHRVAAVQHPFCLITQTTDTLGAEPRPLVMLNHVFGGRDAPKDAPRTVAVLQGIPDLDRETQEKLRSGPPDVILGDILLNGALDIANGQCAVVSMFTPAHVVRNCAIVGRSRFTHAELVKLAATLTSARPPGGS